MAKTRTNETRTAPPRVRALRSLRDMIAALKVGDALPSERILSEDLQINRTSLRWALGRLEQEGVIQMSGMRTRIVAERPESESTNESFRSRCVALMASRHDIGNQNVASGWGSRIAHGAWRVLTQKGYAVLCVGDGTYREQDVELLLQVKPFGVVVPELLDAHEIRVASMRRLTEAGIPVVVYTGRPDFSGFDRVCSDHAVGAREMTQFLINHNCKRIMMLWPDPPSNNYWYPARRRGYEEAMQQAGLEIFPPICFQALPVDIGSRRGFMAMVHYLVGVLQPYFQPSELKQPDAIMLHTDGVISFVAAALRQLGRVPNRDVLLGGYDNYWSFIPERRFESTAPIATIDKSNIELGEELVTLLFDRIEGRLPTEPQTRVIPPKRIALDEALQRQDTLLAI